MVANHFRALMKMKRIRLARRKSKKKRSRKLNGIIITTSSRICSKKPAPLPVCSEIPINPPQPKLSKPKLHMTAHLKIRVGIMPVTINSNNTLLLKLKIRLKPILRQGLLDHNRRANHCKPTLTNQIILILMVEKLISLVIIIVSIRE